MTTQAELISRLREAISQGPPLRLALLFGSHARGTAHAGSDVDVGVVPVDPALSLAAELDLAARLSAAAGAEVDLVRLDGDNLLLGREAALHGIGLHEARPGELARFRAEAMSDWLDFETAAAPARDRWLARLAERGVT